MKPGEVKALIRLLLALCPRSPPKINAAFARAWSRALAPYRAADVEAAALEYARQKEFFPRLAALTGGLKKQTEPEQIKEEVARLQRSIDRMSGAPTEEEPK